MNLRRPIYKEADQFNYFMKQEALFTWESVKKNLKGIPDHVKLHLVQESIEENQKEWWGVWINMEWLYKYLIYMYRLRVYLFMILRIKPSVDLSSNEWVGWHLSE